MKSLNIKKAVRWFYITPALIYFYYLAVINDTESCVLSRMRRHSNLYNSWIMMLSVAPDLVSTCVVNFWQDCKLVTYLYVSLHHVHPLSSIVSLSCTVYVNLKLVGTNLIPVCLPLVLSPRQSVTASNTLHFGKSIHANLGRCERFSKPGCGMCLNMRCV